MTMKLLIDIGNTRLKWATYDRGILGVGKPLPNSALDSPALLALWDGITPPKIIAIANVGGERWATLVRTTLRERWPGVDIVDAKAEACAFGVRNAYRQPEKLGVDRWLALIAVRQRYTGSVVVADCGTAITVDLLDAEGRHSGGYICPGLTAMKRALTQQTDALPYTETRHAVAPADGTEAAIYAGTLSAAAGFIEHVANTQACGAQLILTGGDAECVAAELDRAALIEPWLVLQGLAIVTDGRDMQR